MPAKLDYSTGRTCSQCGEHKPQSLFSWKDGKRRLGSRCHHCRRANHKGNPDIARKNAREYYADHRDEVLRKQRQRRVTDTSALLVLAAKGRAKRLGIPFDLAASDISVPKRCPILDIPLVVNEGTCGPNSPTIDRVVPELGYVRGNVVVISHRANTVKSDATLPEVEAVLRYMKSALAVAVTFADTKRKDVAA